MQEHTLSNRYNTDGPTLLAHLRSIPRERGQKPRGVDGANIDMRPWYRAQSFRQSTDRPLSVRRALALNSILENMPLTIHENDCLAGSMCGAIFGVLPDGVTREDYDQAVEEVSAIGERTFRTNSDHYAPDYQTLLLKGIGGLREDALTARALQRSESECDFLDSVVTALEGVSTLLQRYAAAHRKAASGATDSIRTEHLNHLAELLDRVSTRAPETFHEAVQLVWTFHFIFCLEGRGAMAFGRIDQYLYPFYRRDVDRTDLERGILTRDDAAAILESLWAKLEEPGIPNPIQNIAIGGTTPDGSDGTNDLSFLILEVTGTMSTPASNLSARFHTESSDMFYEACADLVKTGIGFPAMFNEEVLIEGLMNTGVPLEHARDVCFVGCIETLVQGRMPPWSDSVVNMLKALELALHNGVDTQTGNQVGPRTGELIDLPTFGDFMSAFSRQLSMMVSDHVAEINKTKIIDAEQFASPLLSSVTQDCVKRGRDINDGGALYPDFHGIGGMGIGTTTDALEALRTLVYEGQRFSLPDIVAALDRDFDGDEVLRETLLGAPKYGNGDARTSSLAADVAGLFCGFVLDHKTPAAGGKPQGQYVPLLAANTNNIGAGCQVGATPDGRSAYTPLSDAASPHFGRDVHGPTTTLRSLSDINYTAVVGGTVVNMRFQKSALWGKKGTRNLAALVRSYFEMGGAQVQINVADRTVLEDARRNPEKHADLLVRVSGFSAQFVGLPDEVQKDILSRTEQQFAS
jgi:pyruvate-formate lyase